MQELHFSNVSCTFDVPSGTIIFLSDVSIGKFSIKLSILQMSGFLFRINGIKKTTDRYENYDDDPYQHPIVQGEMPPFFRC